MPAERAIHLLRQVCHSLSEAESCGLVHRDIKPANIFVCRYGEDHDFVKVLDFGIVEGDGATPPRPSPRSRRRTSIHGTPAFIAPEQALGASDVDGRADIYATGCVAYWLLTGQLVFTAETPMALLLHHAQTPPTPPSARTELPIPAALDDLVLSCLAKNPAERPQSARELSRRLADIEVATSVLDRGPRSRVVGRVPADPAIRMKKFTPDGRALVFSETKGYERDDRRRRRCNAPNNPMPTRLNDAGSGTTPPVGVVTAREDHAAPLVRGVWWFESTYDDRRLRERWLERCLGTKRDGDSSGVRHALASRAEPGRSESGRW